MMWHSAFVCHMSILFLKHQSSHNFFPQTIRVKFRKSRRLPNHSVRFITETEMETEHVLIGMVALNGNLQQFSGNKNILQCFHAVDCMAGGYPACKNWVARCWRGYPSAASCKCFAHGPADATAIPSSLAPVKSRMAYLSGAGLPRLSWRKGR